MTHPFKDCLGKTICFCLIVQIPFFFIFQRNNFQNNMIRISHDNDDFVLQKKRREAGKVTLYVLM